RGHRRSQRQPGAAGGDFRPKVEMTGRLWRRRRRIAIRLAKAPMSRALPGSGTVNHGSVNGDVVKKFANCAPTFGTPLPGDGCVPSLWKSDCTHVNPSERGLVPFAQRYGPQASHGAVPLPSFKSPAIGSMPRPF